MAPKKGKQPQQHSQNVSADDIDDMDFLPDEIANEIAQQSSQAGSSSSSSLPLAPPPPTQRVNQLDPKLAMQMKTWVCVYPVYIDSTKTMSEGRRVPKDIGISEPVIMFMAEAVRTLQLNCIAEMSKRHPRDPFTFGRLRVQIKFDSEAGDAAGQAVRPNITSKKELLLAICRNYAAAENLLKENDPRIPAMAAASRSVISADIEKLANEANKEVNNAGKPKKKNKKK
ncbi:signal recognition particle subunit [Nowakowskiella sp. JEL0407]|nr:signal recognition particle subunit [Nowakowskiella sp. JEL0407]